MWEIATFQTDTLLTKQHSVKALENQHSIVNMLQMCYLFKARKQKWNSDFNGNFVASQIITHFNWLVNLWQRWNPQYVLNYFLNLMNLSLLHNLNTPQTSWKSSHNVFELFCLQTKKKNTVKNMVKQYPTINGKGNSCLHTDLDQFQQMDDAGDGDSIHADETFWQYLYVSFLNQLSPVSASVLQHLSHVPSVAATHAIIVLLTF